MFEIFLSFIFSVLEVRSPEAESQVAFGGEVHRPETESQVGFSEEVPRAETESQVGLTDERSQPEIEVDIGAGSCFNLSTILAATNNFSSENEIGEGGFGFVYKGTLQDGTEIAVKRLSDKSKQGSEEFKTEVNLIMHLQHKNLVRLLGYCSEGPERVLVYEFMHNNSLHTFLFDDEKCKELDWDRRSNIVIGVAKGLRYLHEDSRLLIIHRDFKTSNILLDNDMIPRISDFGTARVFGHSQTEAATNRVIGSYGYMSPEYASRGRFSISSDVYSFGVVLLEIITGQRNYFPADDEFEDLLVKAWNLWTDNKGEQHRMVQNYPIDKVIRWINIALLCVQEDPQLRPKMSVVVTMLEDQWYSSLPEPSGPKFSNTEVDEFPNYEDWTTTLPLPKKPPLAFSRRASSSEPIMTSGDMGRLNTSSSEPIHPSVDPSKSTTTKTC